MLQWRHQQSKQLEQGLLILLEEVLDLLDLLEEVLVLLDLVLDPVFAISSLIIMETRFPPALFGPD